MTQGSKRRQWKYCLKLPAWSLCGAALASFVQELPSSKPRGSMGID